MSRPSRQAFVLAAVLLLAVAAVAVLAARSKERVIDAAFWFETVEFDASEAQVDRLGGPITPDEMTAIESMAVAEVRRAFDGFRVAFSERRNATYRVRVVQSLRHPMSPKYFGPSGESRAIAGLGGQGAVHFRLLANNAIAHAAADAGRETMIAGIGRGIGRAAVHEFAHLFLGGTAPIHDSTDIRSYEYRSADRREQYYGEMHWDIARPLLETRIGIKGN
jgi:hypothetical protein